MHSLCRKILVCVALLATACLDKEFVYSGTELEGDVAGECSDDAGNDGDGAFPATDDWLPRRLGIESLGEVERVCRGRNFRAEIRGKRPGAHRSDDATRELGL